MSILGMSYYPICKCEKESRFVCKNKDVLDPPEFSVVTGDHLQNISGLEEEDFYLYTTQNYKLHRYILLYSILNRKRNAGHSFCHFRLPKSFKYVTLHSSTVCHLADRISLNDKIFSFSHNAFKRFFFFQCC